MSQHIGNASAETRLSPLQKEEAIEILRNMDDRDDEVAVVCRFLHNEIIDLYHRDRVQSARVTNLE